jgi:hypothetical protein
MSSDSFEAFQKSSIRPVSVQSVDATVSSSVCRHQKRSWNHNPGKPLTRKGEYEMGNALQAKLEGAADPEAAVRESDVVVTTTPSHKPIIKAEWLHPGLHITAVGAVAPEKQEIEARAFGKVDAIACERGTASCARGCQSTR